MTKQINRQRHSRLKRIDPPISKQVLPSPSQRLQMQLLSAGGAIAAAGTLLWTGKTWQSASEARSQASLTLGHALMLEGPAPGMAGFAWATAAACSVTLIAGWLLWHHAKREAPESRGPAFSIKESKTMLVAGLIGLISGLISLPMQAAEDGSAELARLSGKHGLPLAISAQIPFSQASAACALQQRSWLSDYVAFSPEQLRALAPARDLLERSGARCLPIQPRLGGAAGAAAAQPTAKPQIIPLEPLPQLPKEQLEPRGMR